MILRYIISVILIFFSFTSFCQELNKRDTVGLRSLLDQTFKALQKPNFNRLKTISTNSIYCSLCFEKPTGKKPFMMSRQNFIDYLAVEPFSDEIKLAQQSNKIIYEQTRGNYRSDIIVLFTLPNAEEISPQLQLGLYFKKVNGSLKFSGIEIIP